MERRFFTPQILSGMPSIQDYIEVFLLFAVLLINHFVCQSAITDVKRPIALEKYLTIQY